jgi:hypothetical protein
VHTGKTRTEKARDASPPELCNIVLQPLLQAGDLDDGEEELELDGRGAEEAHLEAEKMGGKGGVTIEIIICRHKCCEFAIHTPERLGNFERLLSAESSQGKRGDGDYRPSSRTYFCQVDSEADMHRS